MKANEALMRAIGEIDDDIIAEATLPYRKPLSLGKISAAAAVVALTVTLAVGSGLLRGGLKGNYFPSVNGGSAPEAGGDYSDGSDNSKVEITGRPYLTVYGPITNGEQRLILTIPQHFSADRIDIVFLAVGEDEVYAATDLQTDIIYGDTVCIKEGGVSITVNGEQTDTLPTESGSYMLCARLGDFLERHPECLPVYDLYVDGVLIDQP